MLQSHTPPILPSPARLGLPNPNSPSLPPNPNPNPNPNPSPAPAPAPTTKPPPSASSTPLLRPTRLSSSSSSSTLLPLLPPLPRAQSVLLHMSALATKLFEVSPHRAHWLASFRGSLPSFLPPPSSSAAIDLPPVSSPKEVLSLFTSLQTELFHAVAQLQEIVDLQQSKDKVSDEILSRDAALLAFTKEIREAERILDQLVEDYSDYRGNSKRARRGGGGGDPGGLEFYSSLSLSDILSYAHKVSYTTFAPPEFGAGQAPLRGALPPAPQDEQMRASQLYHFAELDVGVPKKAPEGKERDAAALVEAMKEPAVASRDEAPGAVPGMLLPINVPAGWKKGMPIELPRDLPPMPPGWKPGDPVPLPPLNDLMGAARGDEQRTAAAAPMLPATQVAPPRAPEVIQVKRVQLDINPDEDDYSSEYSSEMGSSDDDDEE